MIAELYLKSALAGWSLGILTSSEVSPAQPAHSLAVMPQSQV
jgi:hypothetical protein